MSTTIRPNAAAPAPSRANLPPQPISHEVLLEKYAKGDEASVEQVRQRIARALAAVEPAEQRTHWEARFLQAQKRGFVPAGRIASAAGTDLTATLINCFVQPVGDSIAMVEDGHPGIYTALTEAAETMRRGGGVGYDFSRIRPQGAWVGSTRSAASGPISYMRVFDRSCETVESAGSRRGAQMGVLRCDHPDIEMFIHAKDQGDLTNFNISIGVTDAFMQAVEHNGDVELAHRAEPSADIKTAGAYQREDGSWVYRKVPARELWDQIMRSTYDHAAPREPSSNSQRCTSARGRASRSSPSSSPTTGRLSPKFLKRCRCWRRSDPRSRSCGPSMTTPCTRSRQEVRLLSSGPLESASRPAWSTLTAWHCSGRRVA